MVEFLLADATLLELEKTLLDATAKFTANPYNANRNHSQVVASRDNCILNNRPLSNGRAVMCKYDEDEVTRTDIDDHNVMHLQNKLMFISSAAAPTAHESCRDNVKYLNLADNNFSNSKSIAIIDSESSFDGSRPIIIANATSSHSNLLNIF